MGKIENSDSLIGAIIHGFVGERTYVQSGHLKFSFSAGNFTPEFGHITSYQKRGKN